MLSDPILSDRFKTKEKNQKTAWTHSPPNIKTESHKPLGRSNSRLSTEENSLNYSVNVKNTSKKVQKFLLGENDRNKLQDNNKRIKTILSQLKDVKIGDVRSQIGMIEFKRTLNAEPKPWYFEFENFSDIEEPKPNSANSGNVVKTKRYKKDIKFDWNSPKKLKPELAFLKSEKTLLDNNYYEGLFKNTDFRELARLNSGTRPETVPEKNSNLKLKFRSSLKLRDIESSPGERVFKQKAEKTLTIKIGETERDNLASLNLNKEESNSVIKTTERTKGVLTEEMMSEKILENLIDKNYLLSESNAQRGEESPQEKNVRLLEQRIVKNMEEIKNIRNQNLESSSPQKKKHTVLTDRISLSQKVETPGKKPKIRKQRGSNEKRKKESNTIVSTEPKLEEKQSEENDEIYSPTYKLRNRMVDMLGQEGIEKQKMIDSFYKEMLNLEGVNQQSLGGDLNEKIIEMPKAFIRNLRKGIQHLNTKLDKVIKEEKKANLESVEKARLAEFTKVNPMMLNMQEIFQIRSLYNAPPEKRKYEDIDRLLIQLKFFRKFNRSTRMSLLKISNLWEVSQGRTIQTEGDGNDTMYVIIRGSVSLIIRQIHEDETHSDDRVASFYDGEHFGEANLKEWSLEREQQLQYTFEKILADKRKKLDEKLAAETKIEKQVSLKEICSEKAKGLEEQKTIEGKNFEKQKTSGFEEKIIKTTGESNPKEETPDKSDQRKVYGVLETAETSIFLYMPGEEFKSIFLNLQKKELESRLELLQTLSFFSKQSSTELVPLANLLSSKIYKFGEIVIREGEIPEGAFLVARGALRVVKEELIHRNSQPSVFCRLSKSLKNFDIGLNDWSESPGEFGKLRTEARDNLDEKEGRKRLFEFQPKSSKVKGQLAYNDLIDKKVFTKGAFFCHRAIKMVHTGEVGQLKLIADNEIEPAKFTVLADSSTVELFILERKNIIFVPDGLKSTLAKALQELTDFDQDMKPEHRHAMRNWTNYKQEISRKTFNRLALKKGLFGFYKKI